MKNIYEKLHDLYENEKFKLWRWNPCDAGAFPVLQPFGRALARLAGHCPCCAGARLALAVTLTAICPTGTPIAIGVVYLAFLTAEVLEPGEDE